MKKVFLILVMGVSIFLISPSLANGESEEKSSRLLFDTVKSLDEGLKETTTSIENVVQETVVTTEKTVKGTVEYTRETVETITDPSEEAPVSTVLQQTEDLLENTVEQTMPIVDQATDAVTETVERTTDEVTSTVDAVADELPSIPVVTPVVNEVREIGKTTTSGVLESVHQTVDAVMNELPTVPVVDPVVEEVRETVERTVSSMQPIEKELAEVIEEPVPETTQEIPDEQEAVSAIEQSSKQLDETAKPTPSSSPGAIKNERSSDNQTKRNSVGTISTEEAIETPANLYEENEKSVEELPTERTVNDVEKVSESATTYVQKAVKKEDKISRSGIFPSENRVLKENPQPAQPVKSGEQWMDHSVATLTSSTSMTTSSSPLIGGHSDISFGLPLDRFSLNVPVGRGWMHSDDETMMQWTHAPPGKPPQRSPFYM